MGGIWKAQSNFTKGELSPLLYGRTDLAMFYQAVEEATNVLSIPQGGLKKRPGTKYVDTQLGDGRLENFSFSTEQNYLMVFTVDKMRVYKDDVLQATVTTPYDTIEKIREFDYIQSADTIIITHPDVQTQIIQRTSDTVWSIGNLSITNTPQFDYNDGSSPTPISAIQTINFANQNFGDRYKISLNGILTDEIVFASDDTTNQNDIARALLELPNTANSGISVTTDVTLDTYRITFSGDSADAWDELTITPVFTKSTGFEVTTTVIQQGASRKEDVWSNTRGWPRTCTFHESRLWFGGSKSRPSTLWGSNVGDPFNFDKGRSRDDQAIDVTLATDQVNAVTGIVSNRALQIFTTGAEFYIPQSPIKPSDITVKPQTNLGSKRVRPVFIEGLTMFVQRTGNALYQFQFLDEFQSNESRSMSLLAPHLINDPIQMYTSQGTSESDANYVYLVGSDGSLTVFNTQSFEGVQAFTRWSTNGNVKSVAVTDEKLYLLVERNGVYDLDVADTLLNTDSAVYDPLFTGTVFTGLTHLNGKTVKVKLGGAAQSDQVVTGGQITLDRAANAESVEVGLGYQPVIKTMPFSIDLNNGPNSAQKKRILRCAIRIDQSNGIIVNGQRLSDKETGVNQFDPPIPQTGYKRVFLHGWSLEAQVTITQETPFPMTVLALDLEVKV
jgi:hypothetical protein